MNKFDFLGSTNKHNTPRTKMGMSHNIITKREKPTGKKEKSLVKNISNQCFKLYFRDPELIIYNKYLRTISKVTTHRY